MTETILIIDDNEDDQRLYRRALKDFSGYDLIANLDAEAGLANTLAIKPSLILLDYNLPDMDGLSFLQKVNKASSMEMPIVMLTGEGNEYVAVEAMKNGASDYIVKDTAGGFLRLLPSVIMRVLASHAERIAARRLKALHRTILHTMADGVIGIGSDGVVLFANPSAEKMLLCAPNELIGRDISQVLRLSESSHWEEHPLVISSNTETSFCRESDALCREDGVSIPVSYTASHLDVDGSSSTGWVLVFQDITARKQAECELFHNAHYDLLTELPNRIMFQEYLEKAISRAGRGQRQLGLFFIDLDGFKDVNDTYGHHVGDQLLQMVAKRLKDCARAGDLISRLGGDEFTLIIEDSQSDYLESVAQKIIRVIEMPYNLMGSDAVHISASIGIASYPQCASDMMGLIDKADKLMYEVKKRGKNGYAFS